MNQKQTFLLAVLTACIALHANTQDSIIISGGVSTDTLLKQDKVKRFRNIVKLNITSLALKTYSIQYERVLNKTISVAASFRTMPVTGLPFKTAVLKAVDEDEEETRETIESLRLSNFAFTPEVRFYVGKKGYGRGFYIAPFYRYAKYNVSNFLVLYESSSGEENKINMSGGFSTNTAGFMLGAQWFIGRRISLDWWILGPHYGSGNGDFNGVSTQALTQYEQDDLRNELESLDIPLLDKTVSVNANRASLKLDGPWGGVRAGISIGIRF